MDIFISVAVVGSAVGLLLIGLYNRRFLRSWHAAAEACGLHVLSTGPPFRARKEPEPLEVRFDESEGHKTQVAIVVPGAPPDFHQVRIRPEATHPYQYQWVPEIESGDAQFDAAFRIEGPARPVLAMLDARTRHLLLHASSESRLEISLGEIRALVLPWKLVSILPHLLEIGQRLSRIMDLPHRLAENARSDPEVGVRLQNLLLLARELPGHPVTRKALRAACSDLSPQVRLRAAKELGAEGRDILLDYAENEEDDALSAAAVSILDRELPVERARDILFEALRRRRLLTARACLETLGKSGDAAAVAMLAEALEREGNEMAAAAALALGATGSPAAEPPLLRALQREDTQVAAADALARVGSAAAVLPLKEAAERSPEDKDLRRATRQAIGEIQSRLQGATPGQLSLAGTEAGQLSLAQTEAGQLSLASEEAGQLSFPEEPEEL